MKRRKIAYFSYGRTLNKKESQEDFAARFGEEYLGWDVPEYRAYERGRGWYAAAAFIGVGLLIYSVLSANFLFALFIIMFSIMVYLTVAGEPRNLRFSITESGIRLGNTHRPFREISRFWMIYEPPKVKSLYIEFKSSLRPRMTIDLTEANPNQVREVLSQFAIEDFSEDSEPFSDFIGRMIKL